MGDSNFFISAELLFAAVGVGLMLIISRFDYRMFKKFSMPLMAVCLVLLLVVLFMPALNNARRWIFVAGVFSFQPSEITKFAVILLFSHWMSVYQNQMHTLKYGVVPYASVLAIVGSLMILQPHLSGTLIIMTIGAVLMFVGGTRLVWFAVAGGIVALFAVGGLVFIDDLVPYAMDRIAVWQDPFIDPQGDSYQTIQSMLAIGSGGLFGLGLGNSRQKHLYLPEPQNDFIFSVICEELGFIGGFLVMLLFILLFIRGIMIAVNARDRFGALLVVGIMTQVIGQALLNIAVTTNTIPNTGISLPFFSSGGTSLLMLLAEMGIVLSVSRQSRLTKS